MGGLLYFYNNLNYYNQKKNFFIFIILSNNWKVYWVKIKNKLVFKFY